MKSPTLLVLAAGMGSRYGGLKQIDPVGPSQETVLDYSVFDALRSGFKKIVFVIRRDFEAEFREKAGRRFEGRAEVRYAFQEIDRLPGGRRAPAGREKPWGTGHAVWCAAGELAEPFAVINADDYYGADSFGRLGAFLSAADAAAAPAPCCMIGFRLDRTLSEHGTVSRGICSVGADGRLAAVEECTAIERAPGGGALQKNAGGGGGARVFSGSEVVSMNCWGFTPAILPALERELARFLDAHGAAPKAEFYLPFAVAAMIERREADVRVLPTVDSWFGITYREDRPRVVAALRAHVREGIYPERLWG
ncbi:MAG: nucleotidyltransferase [Opitutaceae bacterium]|nr:nucleotidyltransferase [Opitutaceae bacterium]